MSKYLIENLKYSQKAVKEKTAGKVIAAFVVNVDGTLSDIEMIRGASPELDAETLGVISIIHKWIPS